MVAQPISVPPYLLPCAVGSPPLGLGVPQDRFSPCVLAAARSPRHSVWGRAKLHARDPHVARGGCVIPLSRHLCTATRTASPCRRAACPALMPRRGVPMPVWDPLRAHPPQGWRSLCCRKSALSSRTGPPPPPAADAGGDVGCGRCSGAAILCGAPGVGSESLGFTAEQRCGAPQQGSCCCSAPPAAFVFAFPNGSFLQQSASSRCL